MIYMVECALSEHSSEADWQAWYADMKPPAALLSVPGLTSVQRFKGADSAPAPYLALYSVASAEVLSSDHYRQIGGGKFRTDRWKPMIAMWHRNLFDDAPEAPEVGQDEVLVMLDRDRPDDAGDIPLLWLRAVGLDCSTAFRGIAVLPPERAASAAEALPDLRTFTPLLPRLTSGSSDGPDRPALERRIG